MVTTPFYASASPDESVAHFARVAESSDLPVLAYDIPSRTGVKLSTSVLERLAREEIVVGLKDSSGDLTGFRAAVDISGRHPLRLFTGSELLVDVALFAGADGAVPGLANVDPHGFVALYDACLLYTSPSPRDS